MKLFVLIGILLLFLRGDSYHIIDRSKLVLTNFSNISFLPFRIAPKNDYFHSFFLNNTNKVDSLLTEEEEKGVEDAQIYSGNPDCQIFIPSLLTRMNTLRAKHNATALNWSVTIARGAQWEALKYEGVGCPVFRPPPVSGRIISFKLGELVNEVELVDSWYEGAYFWDYRKNVEKKKGTDTTQFLQLLWNSTKEVGCGKACCLETDVWICDFSPGAELETNNMTIYKANIFPPKAEYKQTLQ